jgi:peptide/nickel transport system substrate-binding protein
VPNVAKGWEFNDDFTQLTFFLRKGHKWSDGHPFTAEDVKYWYKNLSLNPKVYEKPKNYVLVADKPMTVDVLDPQTVRFNLPAPKPGLLVHFARMQTRWRRQPASKTVLKYCRTTTAIRIGPIHQRRC